MIAVNGEVASVVDTVGGTVGSLEDNTGIIA